MCCQSLQVSAPKPTIEPITALRQYFGLDDFRHPQAQIIADVLAGRDCMVIMPTGGGKSLCYQLPSLLLPGVSIVVSPLIALMKDQVDGLTRRGIAAGFINSSQSWAEQVECLRDVERGRIKLLYVAPERFRAKAFMQAMVRLRVSLLAIDEAHCLSQWGHDFRPDYLRLGDAHKALGQPTCIALTATATPDVREDILRCLELRQPQVYVSGFARPNLAFQVIPIERMAEKMACVMDLVTEHGTGIIYGATRKSVEKISTALAAKRVRHAVYHAGLTDQERSRAQERFMSGKVDIAVATNAFGMGIDRADIRFVCHYEMPGSVEAYYQEGGRAGRDGAPAVCQMLFLYADKRVQEFFNEGANPGKALIVEVFRLLQRIADAEGEVRLSIDDITAQMPRKVNPMAVGTALAILSRHQLIDRFDIPGLRIRGTRVIQPDIAPHSIAIDESALAEKAQRDDNKLRAVIQFAYAKTCRQRWILRYFGELETEDCGKCDICLARSGKPARELAPEQLEVVRKALSVVARMSDRMDRDHWVPRYGRYRILQCACGARSIKFPTTALEKLSTWGVLRPYGKAFVADLFDAMEMAGLIEPVEKGDFQLLGLTQLGSQVMRGARSVRLDYPKNSKPGKKK